MKHLLVVLFISCTLVGCSDTGPTGPVVIPQSVIEEVEEGLKNLREWKTGSQVDRMTDEKSYYAYSEWSDNLGLEFPYEDNKARLIYVCNKDYHFLLFEFSDGMLLNGTDYDHNDGRTYVSLRIRWYSGESSEIDSLSFSIDYDRDALYFVNPNLSINKVRESSSLLAEFDWYNQGYGYAEISLLGASDRIEETLDKCRSIE